MKNDVLILFDRTWYLMIKTSRSKNHWYKVSLQAEIIKCLQIATTTESSRWHVRLGHISTETIKAMISKELVVAYLI